MQKEGNKPDENIIYLSFISSFLHDDENKTGNVLSVKAQVALRMH